MKTPPLKPVYPADKFVESFDAELLRIGKRSPQAASALRGLLEKRPHLEAAVISLGRAYLAIAECFDREGTLYISGNGGSMADALHIAGELLKSYKRSRPLGDDIKARLMKEPDGGYLASNLEKGLRAIALGTNPTLISAIDNDFEGRWLGIAQELNALARQGDAFLGISTSGKAKNIYYATIVANAIGATSILLTGEVDSKLSEISDISIHAPGQRTDVVQEEHIALYHCLCDMLEVDFFGS